MTLTDTITAIATPPGIGALGIVRLAGPMAISICNDLFYGKDLSKMDSHTLHFGTIRNKNKIIDEVVVSLFRSPKSYTSDDMIEVSCHGSPYILQQIVRLFTQKGARLAEPGEFSMRAFLNGKLDLSQAEAVADLISSENEAAHQLAIKQLRGGFSKQINDLRQQLTDFAALIELELDFSEEDVQFADRTALLKLIDQIRGLTRQLSDSFRLGNALKNGVTVVIAGRPNAGKSTLLNALLNEERAIVSEIAGTTRDTIEENLNINGIPFRLIDTAGLREATDAIEKIGVARTMEKLQESAIALFLFDVNTSSVDEVKNDLKELALEEISTILVGNQIDKTAIDYAQKFSAIEHILFLSSKDKTNLDTLQDRLCKMVVQDEVNTGNTIVSNLRHYEALTKADESLEALENGMQSGLSGELLALDIRQALHYLGEITGAVTTDDLLGSIFSRFCIGK